MVKVRATNYQLISSWLPMKVTRLTDLRNAMPYCSLFMEAGV